MAEVPHDLARIFPAAVEPARGVAAELERLRVDLARCAAAVTFGDAAKNEGLALLTEAHDALEALRRQLESAADAPVKSESP